MSRLRFPFLLGLGMAWPQPMLVAAGGRMSVALAVGSMGLVLMAIGVLRGFGDRGNT